MKKILLGFCAVMTVSLVLLIGIVLCPSFLYSKSTTIGKVSIYHSQSLDTRQLRFSIDTDLALPFEENPVDLHQLLLF